jgi:hypothetical protein
VNTATRGIAALAVASATMSLGLRTAPHSAMPAFGAGERLEYAVSFGRLHVGSGEMSLVALDTTTGPSAWEARLTVSGGVPFFHVRDTMSSLFDTATFTSRRFTQHINEGRYHARRDFAIDPLDRTYVKNDGAPSPSSADPVDDVSLIYLVRTLPLADGDRYEFNRYFQPDQNPITIRVVRRERITVPAGSYAAILIEPEIRATGIFSQKGRAQLWFSDDSSRLLLQMKARLSIGSINLYLTHAMRATSPRSALSVCSCPVLLHGFMK